MSATIHAWLSLARSLSLLSPPKPGAAGKRPRFQESPVAATRAFTPLVAAQDRPAPVFASSPRRSQVGDPRAISDQEQAFIDAYNTRQYWRDKKVKRAHANLVAANKEYDDTLRAWATHILDAGRRQSPPQTDDEVISRLSTDKQDSMKLRNSMHKPGASFDQEAIDGAQNQLNQRIAIHDKVTWLLAEEKEVQQEEKEASGEVTQAEVQLRARIFRLERRRWLDGDQAAMDQGDQSAIAEDAFRLIQMQKALTAWAEAFIAHAQIEAGKEADFSLGLWTRIYALNNILDYDKTRHRVMLKLMSGAKELGRKIAGAAAAVQIQESLLFEVNVQLGLASEDRGDSILPLPQRRDTIVYHHDKTHGRGVSINLSTTTVDDINTYFLSAETAASEDKVSYLPRVRRVQLTLGAAGLRDIDASMREAIHHIAKAYPNVQRLDFVATEDLQLGLDTLTEAWKDKLEHLTIRGSTLHDFAEQEPLLMPALKTLHLSLARQADVYGTFIPVVGYTGKKVGGLKTLRLTELSFPPTTAADGTQAGNEIWAKLCQQVPPTVTTLSVQGSRDLPGDWILRLPEATQKSITSLNLSRMTDVPIALKNPGDNEDPTHQTSSTLLKLTSLETLDWSNADLPTSVFAILNHSTQKIVSLDISNSKLRKASDDDYVRTSDANYLYGLDDKTKLTSLTNLDMSGLGLVDSKWLLPLTHLTSLQTLNLSGNRLSNNVLTSLDEDLSKTVLALAKLKDLKTLHLPGGINGSDLAPVMAQLPLLEIVKTQLDDTKSSVGDKGFVLSTRTAKGLAQAPRLWHLDLSRRAAPPTTMQKPQGLEDDAPKAFFWGWNHTLGRHEPPLLKSLDLSYATTLPIGESFDTIQNGLFIKNLSLRGLNLHGLAPRASDRANDTFLVMRNLSGINAGGKDTFGGLRHLESLDLRDSLDIDNRTLNEVVKIKTLVSLSLPALPTLNWEILQQLPRLRYLRVEVASGGAAGEPKRAAAVSGSILDKISKAFPDAVQAEYISDNAQQTAGYEFRWSYPTDVLLRTPAGASADFMEPRSKKERSARHEAWKWHTKASEYRASTSKAGVNARRAYLREANALRAWATEKKEAWAVMLEVKGGHIVLGSGDTIFDSSEEAMGKQEDWLGALRQDKLDASHESASVREIYNDAERDMALHVALHEALKETIEV